MYQQQDEESNEDWHLFRQAVQDVIPLYCDKVPLELPPPSTFPKQRFLDERQVLHDLLSEKFDPAEMETGDELLFLREGIQRSVLRKLRRGQFSINAELDLHGLIVSQAREAVVNFLHYCLDRGLRCVRIVHGKGYGSWQKQPVLKWKLNHWLRQRDEVLALCPARSIDGGTGAVYVLLKNR